MEILKFAIPIQNYIWRRNVFPIHELKSILLLRTASGSGHSFVILSHRFLRIARRVLSQFLCSLTIAFLYIIHAGNIPMRLSVSRILLLLMFYR